MFVDYCLGRPGQLRRVVKERFRRRQQATLSVDALDHLETHQLGCKDNAFCFYVVKLAQSQAECVSTERGASGRR